jgi:hypothetical protein
MAQAELRAMFQRPRPKRSHEIPVMAAVILAMFISGRPMAVPPIFFLVSDVIAW